MKWLRHFKKGWQDRTSVVDPEHDFFKSALRTALSCAICLLLFQYLDNAKVGILAAFAAFSFAQNDPLGLPTPRFIFLSGIILLFTSLAFVGMVLSVHKIAFVLSILPIAFACAYASCLGPQYFNAGVWALFLYIFAAANPASVHDALQISAIFLLSGGICVLICFGVFPNNVYARLLNNFRLILESFHAELACNPVTQHSDQLLALQHDNGCLYFKQALYNQAQHVTIQTIATTLAKINLLIKSTQKLSARIDHHANFEQTGLASCHQQIVQLVLALIAQLRQQTKVDFKAVEILLEQCRDRLTALRQELLRVASVDKVAVDFRVTFDYSNYLYHFLKLHALLKSLSYDLASLQEAVK